MTTAVRGALLAGGRGSRMGGGKPLVELAGRPLLAHVLDAFAVAGLHPAIVAKPSTGLEAFAGAGDPPAELIEEPEQPTHALLGIATALARLRSPVVVCACDMPLVPGELLAWLAQQNGHDAVVCHAGGFLQPLLGRYEPSVLDALSAAVDAGDSGRTFVESLGERARVVGEQELARFGAVERIMFDVDTPEDAVRAEYLLAGE